MLKDGEKLRKEIKTRNLAIDIGAYYHSNPYLYQPIFTMAQNKQPPSSLAGMDEESKEKFRKMVANFVPYDPRFPNQNQTRNCQQNYMDYHRCLKKKNGDEEYCHWYKNAYTRLCPPDWYEKWDEQRENGTFPIPELLP